MPDIFEHYVVSTRSSIGPRYRQLLFDILMANPFKNVLEIGCLRGYSSCAFIEAINRGRDFDYTICDPAPRGTFADVLNKCTAMDRVHLVQKLSVDCIQPGYDFIFVAGDHSLQYVPKEIARLLEVNFESVLAHDTYIEIPRYFGAHQYRHIFEKHPDYFYIDDGSWDPSSEQQRCGVSFFTRRSDVFERVKELFGRLNTRVNSPNPPS